MSDEQRTRFVAAARSYIGTPYHHMGRVRGAGVDCATLLLNAAEEAGMIEHMTLAYYPPDWHLHRGAERYLGQLMKFAIEIEGPPLPGDVVMFRFGRSFSHAGIVLEWPKIVHAFVGRAVGEDDAEAAQWLAFIGESDPQQGKPRPRKFFTFWPPKD